MGGGGGGRGAKAKVHSTFWSAGGVGGGLGGGGGRGAKAKVHSTFWVVGGVGGVGGWCVVGGGLGKVGWVVSVWVRSVGLSWAGFVELSSVGWVPESGVRGHRRIRHRHLH